MRLLGPHSGGLRRLRAGSHNYTSVATPGTSAINPTKPQPCFCVLRLPEGMNQTTSEFPTPIFMFENKPRQASMDFRKRRIWHGQWLLGANLPVRRRQRLWGAPGRGRGVGSPHLSLPYSPSLVLFLARQGWREPYRLTLLAWPFIMHETIPNLLGLVYHLQRINNGILASWCRLSNSMNMD